MEEGGATGEGRRLAIGWQGLIASLASALLHVLAFPPINLPETAYVFAGPLLLYALFSERAKGEGWRIFLGGWLGWAVLLAWLRHVTAHLEGPLAAGLGWFAPLAMSAIMALFWWGWFMGSLFLVRRSREQALPARLMAVLACSALWVLLEWARTVLFSGFPWLLLSVSQWERPLLLQIASVTGASGISFILIAFNLGLSFYLYNLWRNRRARWWERLSGEFYLALLLLFASIGYGFHASGAGREGRIPGPRVAFVQPDAGAIEKWDPALIRENLQVLDDLTTYAQYLGAELVLWPESPTPRAVKGDPVMQDWVEAVSRETGLPLLIGNIAIERSEVDGAARFFNAVFTVDPAAGVETEAYYAKRHLVPFGEYVPLAGWLPFLRKVVPVPGDFFPGESAQPLEIPGLGRPFSRVGILICYEDVFPRLARDNVRAGAAWHYVATNNVWFGEGAAAWQHAAHSVLRAVETRRPVVRCGNAGWSGWIDEFGQIRHVMLDDEQSVYFQGVESVPLSLSRYWAGRSSLYVRHGDYFTGLCALLLLVAWPVLRWSPVRAAPGSRRIREAHPLMSGRDRFGQRLRR